MFFSLFINVLIDYHAGLSVSDAAKLLQAEKTQAHYYFNTLGFYFRSNISCNLQ